MTTKPPDTDFTIDDPMPDPTDEQAAGRKTYCAIVFRTAAGIHTLKFLMYADELASMDDDAKAGIGASVLADHGIREEDVLLVAGGAHLHLVNHDDPEICIEYAQWAADLLRERIKAVN